MHFPDVTKQDSFLQQKIVLADTFTFTWCFRCFWQIRKRWIFKWSRFNQVWKVFLNLYCKNSVASSVTTLEEGNVSRKSSWRQPDFVNLLRISVIQLTSIISNYSIRQMLFKMLFNFFIIFQITNHLICSLFNSCMTLMEFIPLYRFINICCYLFSPEGLLIYRLAIKKFLSSTCIANLTVNTSRQV